MDLFRRLWQIARAQVGSGGEGSAPGADFGEFRPPRQESPPATDPGLVQYYANLEIPYGADLETARRAWKRLLKQCHPDLHARDPEKRRVAGELSARLTQAFQELEKALKAKEHN